MQRQSVIINLLLLFFSYTRFRFRRNNNVDSNNIFVLGPSVSKRFSTKKLNARDSKTVNALSRGGAKRLILFHLTMIITVIGERIKRRSEKRSQFEESRAPPFRISACPPYRMV